MNPEVESMNEPKMNQLEDEDENEERGNYGQGLTETGIKTMFGQPP